MSLEDKFKGCLVGLAVGDALGAPLEEIKNHPCTIPKPVKNMIGGGYLNLKPGQVTDDTEMMLCIARSLVENKYFDPEDIAKRFVEWYDDGGLGIGKTTRAAIKRLKEGVPWNKAGHNEKGLTLTGNGSVMRCAPLSLRDYNNNSLAKHSIDQSLITHPHQDCYVSSMFVNFFICYLFEGKSKKGAFKEALRHIRYTPLIDRYEMIPGLSELKLSGEVKETVESAVFCFLKTDTLEDAVVKAVNLGGDADTRGAVTGALAGAFYGEKSIPKRWKEKLIDRHERPIYEELCSLSNSLYKWAKSTKY